jgi:hypothetical protein
MEAAVPAIWKRERGRRASVLEVGAAALLIAGAAYLATSNSRINGPSVTFSQSAQHVDAYDFVEVSAAVRGAAANPFTDAAFTGSFETADHRRKWQVNGFCDSDPGNVFRIRFMPDAPGEYSYRVEYRQGESAFVKTGVFHAGNGGRRGSLRVDPRNRWHFIWEGTGEHYFFNGSTAYWLAGWRDENVIRSSIERFARLKVNRLRVTLAGRTAVLYGEPVIDGRNWTAFLTAWPAQSPKDIYHPGFNYKRFDIPYWQKFERLLRAAREKDIVISVVLDMADSRVHPEGPDEYRFLRYAIARLAAYSNVTWDLGDDLDGFRDDVWARETGSLIKQWDPYRRLATSHPVHPEHQDRAAEWFDFTSVQDWSRRQHAFMLDQRRLQERTGRIIPQTNEEYGYEDHYPMYSLGGESDSADALRRCAWEIVMAGAYQTTGETARRGTGIWPDSGGGWVNGRGDDSMTMLQGYARMVDFFTSFEWWQASPHDELVAGGHAFCLAKPGDTYALYLPRGGTASVRLQPGTYAVSWYDPATGETAALPDAKGGLWKSPAAPGPGDWALLLQSAGRTGRFQSSLSR